MHIYIGSWKCKPTLLHRKYIGSYYGKRNKFYYTYADLDAYIERLEIYRP